MYLAKMYLRSLYNSKKAKCCKCGCTLSTDNGSLGDYFVLDNNGNYYCADCDDIFEDEDERIFMYEEGESMSLEKLLEELAKTEMETEKALIDLTNVSRETINTHNRMMGELHEKLAELNKDLAENVRILEENEKAIDESSKEINQMLDDIDARLNALMED